MKTENLGIGYRKQGKRWSHFRLPREILPLPSNGVIEGAQSGSEDSVFSEPFALFLAHLLPPRRPPGPPLRFLAGGFLHRPPCTMSVLCATTAAKGISLNTSAQYWVNAQGCAIYKEKLAFFHLYDELQIRDQESCVEDSGYM